MHVIKLLFKKNEVKNGGHFVYTIKICVFFVYKKYLQICFC